MGFFKDELTDLTPAIDESLMQRDIALSSLRELQGELLRMRDRSLYYKEPMTLEALEGILEKVRYVVKILD